MKSLSRPRLQMALYFWPSAVGLIAVLMCAGIMKFNVDLQSATLLAVAIVNCTMQIIVSTRNYRSSAFFDLEGTRNV